MASSTISVKVDMTRAKQLREALQPRAAQIIHKAAFEVEAGAKERAPVLTGALRNSITTELNDRELSAKVGPTVEYGIYVELGTRRMRPRPYLLPAFERVRATFKRAWDELVR